MIRKKNILPLFYVMILCIYSSWIQAGEIYVDPSHAQSQDSGTGERSRPYKSISFAVKQLLPGDELIIAGGVYEDSIIFPERNWQSAKETIIRSVKNEKVVIKGSSLVSGWKPLKDGIYVKPNWPHNSQQVFVNSLSLQQIGGSIFNGYPDKKDHPLLKRKREKREFWIWPGRIQGGLAEMTENSFFYDKRQQKLYIKLDLDINPEKQKIEVSLRPYLLSGRGLRNLVIRGLYFRHSNTSDKSRQGAISLVDCSHILLDNIHVSHADTVGIHIKGNNNVIKNCSAHYCGQIGMAVKGNNNKILYNETHFNNTRGFNKLWAAGGCKFIGGGGLRESQLIGHKAFYNNADGIWFDWLNQITKFVIAGVPITVGTAYTTKRASPQLY